MYKIDKEFNFCYGHRVWTQELNTKYSMDNACACRRLHGHNGLIKVGLEAQELKNGMVTDFKHLNFFKKILDDDFDHKFIMDINDPLFDLTFSLYKMFLSDYKNGSDIIIDKKFYKTINVNALKRYNFEREITELYEGLVIVDFVPTSENLSKMFYEVVKEKLGDFAKVSFIDFWETPKSHCRYNESI